MTQSLMLALGGSFFAGVVTSLTPCVYPMLPITLGFLGAKTESSNRRLRFVLFFAGQVLTLTLLGSIAVALGEVFGFSSEMRSVQLVAAILLAVMAYFSFRGELPAFFNRIPLLQGFSGQTVFGAFALGATSALLASPCTSPVLGGILVALSTEADLFKGVMCMAAYATGLSSLFLLIGLGLMRLSKLPRAGAWMTIVHKASTVLLALGSLYFFATYLQVL